MSWSQDYSIESYLELLIRLTGKHPEELLEEALNAKGVHVTSKETVTLDDDGMFGDVVGVKVTLSDGRVLVPKLVEQFTENGNHGIDVYEYRLADDVPDVKYVDRDSTNPDVDVYDVPEGYGDEDEFPCGWDA